MRIFDYAEEMQEARDRLMRQIADFLVAHPDMLYRDVAPRFECSESLVSRSARKFKVPRRLGRPPKVPAGEAAVHLAG